LRRSGVDSFLLTSDVDKALQQHGVLDKTPTSRKDWLKLQDQINQWRTEGDHPLTHLRQMLALSRGRSI